MEHSLVAQNAHLSLPLLQQLCSLPLQLAQIKTEDRHRLAAATDGLSLLDRAGEEDSATSTRARGVVGVNDVESESGREDDEFLLLVEGCVLCEGDFGSVREAFRPGEDDAPSDSD